MRRCDLTKFRVNVLQWRLKTVNLLSNGGLCRRVLDNIQHRLCQSREFINSMLCINSSRLQLLDNITTYVKCLDTDKWQQMRTEWLFVIHDIISQSVSQSINQSINHQLRQVNTTNVTAVNHSSKLNVSHQLRYDVCFMKDHTVLSATKIELCLPLLVIFTASSSLHPPTERWPGWTDLGGNTNMVIHRCINWAWHTAMLLTWLMLWSASGQWINSK